MVEARAANIGDDHLCIYYHEVQLQFEEPSKSNCNDQIVLTLEWIKTFSRYGGIFIGDVADFSAQLT